MRPSGPLCCLVLLSPAACAGPVPIDSDPAFTVLPAALLYELLLGFVLDRAVATVAGGTSASDGAAYAVRATAFSDTSGERLHLMVVSRDPDGAQEVAVRSPWQRGSMSDGRMSLFVIILASSLGTGYFLYGKRETRGGFMLAGAGLCLYPLVVSGPWLLSLVGAALAAAPFFVDF